MFRDTFFSLVKSGAPCAVAVEVYDRKLGASITCIAAYEAERKSVVVVLLLEL